MPRVAFELQIREGKIAEYDEAHRQVWPELLAELTAFGVTDYSIFRRGHRLVLCMNVPDFQVLVQQLAKSNVNLRWQETMAPLFAPVPGLLPGETYAMMEEVFFMPGNPA